MEKIEAKEVKVVLKVKVDDKTTREILVELPRDNKYVIDLFNGL